MTIDQADSPKEELDKQQAAGEKLSRYREEYEKLTSQKGTREDPLSILSAVIIRAVQNFDVATIKETASVIKKLSAEFIEEYGGKHANDEWHSEMEITSNFTKEILNHITLYYDHCDTGHYDYARFELLGLTQDLVGLLGEKSLDREIGLCLAFWKQIADKRIGKAPREFCRILEYYRELFSASAAKGFQDRKDLLDEIWRHVGWLGERALMKVGVEEAPLMMDWTFKQNPTL